MPSPDSNPFAPGTFPYFPLLPAELRLKIWALSLAPRTIELHTRRTHYADSDAHRRRVPQWQSLSRNPALLAVSAEARAAALEFYTVALPLAAPFGRKGGYGAFERPGDMLSDSDRVLYISLEADTVVLLGDLHYGRLTTLLEWFRAQDVGRGRAGKGVRRLAMGVAQWAHEVGARTLKAFARSVFADLEEFVLFMYKERMPPEEWTGGRCVLEEACLDDDYYRRFVIGKGKQFREGNGWMAVGKRPMKVVDLQFLDGW
ncbi:hypothetical protein B0H67DRAFT_489774 [Lasiosphaeris hirsuta]|uniref:2EXR domain-containing protein n=1 Tax=Lasiosphaeris hirsuta TaxID=260670 RepID=A0AA40DWF8_9PEZI|nr:hypothetical protein B0H67DRAFT_489774 [Lasiosphaeris hirsuta]